MQPDSQQLCPTGTPRASTTLQPLLILIHPPDSLIIVLGLQVRVGHLDKSTDIPVNNGVIHIQYILVTKSERRIGFVQFSLTKKRFNAGDSHFPLQTMIVTATSTQRSSIDDENPHLCERPNRVRQHGEREAQNVQ